MKNLTRRNFGTYLGATTFSLMPSLTVAKNLKAVLPTTNNARIVVVGGGWSGLSIARYLKQENNDIDVILIERRTTFFSLPLSNLWLGGLVPRSRLIYRFEDAAEIGGYTYFNANVLDLDRVKQRIRSDKGWIDYDVLVLAPGIEYDYTSMGIKDPDTMAVLKSSYPAGFISVKEQEVIVDSLKNFKKGVFILTVPPGIYRCAASPYERACLVAAFFKRNSIKGKVVLIDGREKPAVNSMGFLAAFSELYSGYIEYMNSTVIRGVNPHDRVLKTDFDEIKFEGAAIYPRIRAARMIERFGIHNPNSVQKDANIDPFKYHVIGDDKVYVTGDCRPMPFSKSASVANSEARYIAKLIVARLQGKEVKWMTPESICYSMVNTQPEEAILSHSFYQFDQTSGQWAFDPKSKADNIRRESYGLEAYSWVNNRLNDLFG
jgi:NADH dehydrogenase FAD-containing subunit